MRTLFKYPDGRLRTSRISLLVFIGLIVSFSVIYQARKPAEKVMLQVSHVLEKAEPVEPVQPPPEPEAKPPEATQPKATQPIAERPEAKQPKAAQPVAKQPDTKKTEVAKQVPAAAKEKAAPQKTAAVPKKAVPEPAPAAKTKAAAKKTESISKPRNQEEPFRTFAAAEPENNTVEFASRTYYDLLKQWQEQGAELDHEKTLVGLEIFNLEKVYNLFQMKVVAVKGGVPHTDLGDQTRIAQASLDEFSSTCFVVGSPWLKWGDQLKASGFEENEAVQVRYYTYDFVRNAIYARAMKAFEWAVNSSGMAGNADPSTAKVTGAVYEIRKAGGGSFGVFVPQQVAFNSSKIVTIDALACFKGAADINALHQAGKL